MGEKIKGNKKWNCNAKTDSMKTSKLAMHFKIL